MKNLLLVLIYANMLTIQKSFCSESYFDSDHDDLSISSFETEDPASAHRYHKYILQCNAQLLAIQDIKYSYAALYEKKEVLCMHVISAAISRNQVTKIDPQTQERLYLVDQEEMFKYINNRLNYFEKKFLSQDIVEPSQGGAIGKTKCGHIFHKSCIKAQMKHNHTCPLCRATLRRKSDIQYILPFDLTETRCAICQENFPRLTRNTIPQD